MSVCSVVERVGQQGVKAKDQVKVRDLAIDHHPVAADRWGKEVRSHSVVSNDRPCLLRHPVLPPSRSVCLYEVERRRFGLGDAYGQIHLLDRGC